MENQKQLTSRASSFSKSERIYRGFSSALFGIEVALVAIGLAGGLVATFLTAGMLTHVFIGIAFLGMVLTGIGLSMLKSEDKSLERVIDLADNLNKIAETVNPPCKSGPQAEIGLSK